MTRQILHVGRNYKPDDRQCRTRNKNDHQDGKRNAKMDASDRLAWISVRVTSVPDASRTGEAMETDLEKTGI
jgi:hypothetical protein